MKYDIVLTGLEQQGVLSIAGVIVRSATAAGLHVAQSHSAGRESRKQAVVASVQLSDRPIAAVGIGERQADLVIGFEPLETAQALHYLSPAGQLITATDPVLDIEDYPQITDVLWSVLRFPHAHLLDGGRVAFEATGDASLASFTILGGATDYLPLTDDGLRSAIEAVEGGRAAAQQRLAAWEAGRRTLQHREIVDEFETFAGATI